MLKRIENAPLDYSLCNSTVTVYRREGLTRLVLQGAHYEMTRRREVVDGVAKESRGFLLVIPGDTVVLPGDMVMRGYGPKIQRWEDLKTANFSSLGLITSVQQRYWNGQLCHTEARG